MSLTIETRKSDAVAALYVVALFLYCLSTYPGVLSHTWAIGFDAKIYWEAMRNELKPTWLSDKTTMHYGWAYSAALLEIFRPLGKLPYWAFLSIIHLGNSLATAAVCWKILQTKDRYPILAWSVALFLGSQASDALASGNLSASLCGIALSPLGAVVACAFKPYYALAVVFHAACWVVRRRRELEAHDVP